MYSISLCRFYSSPTNLFFCLFTCFLITFLFLPLLRGSPTKSGRGVPLISNNGWPLLFGEVWPLQRKGFTDLGLLFLKQRKTQSLDRLCACSYILIFLDFILLSWYNWDGWMDGWMDGCDWLVGRTTVVYYLTFFNSFVFRFYLLCFHLLLFYPHLKKIIFPYIYY